MGGASAALGLAMGSWHHSPLEGTNWRRIHLLTRLSHSRRYEGGPKLAAVLLSAAWRPGWLERLGAPLSVSLRSQSSINDLSGPGISLIS